MKYKIEKSETYESSNYQVLELYDEEMGVYRCCYEAMTLAEAKKALRRLED